jgi:hypothetical protein
MSLLQIFFRVLKKYLCIHWDTNNLPSNCSWLLSTTMSTAVNREIFMPLIVGEFASFQLAVDKIPHLLQKFNGYALEFKFSHVLSSCLTVHLRKS